LLYEEMMDDKEYDHICEEVASTVTIHHEFLSLLRLVAKEKHVRAVVVTCGLRRVWDKVLEREGLSETVKVIGGGRIMDGYVVTATVKAALVTRLQQLHRAYVWAFGDSPLDLDMLLQAQQGIVVVGEKHSRSKTMDTALVDAINNYGIRLKQTLLPKHESPRLDTTKLPLLQLGDEEVIRSIFCRRGQQAGIQVIHATSENAAKILMTPMRDANLHGPDLREAHRRVGYYLGTRFISDVIGVEEYSIKHVQNRTTDGYRLCHEQQTLIVALMRGGESMAFGVSDAFPLATFLHAKGTNDIKPDHLQDQKSILLVDSVVNTGKTVMEFVKHVRNLNPTIRIIVVAGVVQEEFISNCAGVQVSDPQQHFYLVALRLSANKYKGKGNTDTGNRLFNTTHLD